MLELLFIPKIKYINLFASSYYISPDKSYYLVCQIFSLLLFFEDYESYD